ncbi:cohesin domain-containing protein [Paenibacillus planticolens]|nr:cohesin domain-containing protein [Paenibacillus planticolens]
MTSAALNGVSSVVGGMTFDLTYGLEGAKENIYAQDFVVKYDPNKVQFISADSVNDGFAIVANKEAPGQIRFIAASLGEGNAVKGNADLLKLTWRAKPTTGWASISVSNAVVSDAAGKETEAEVASHAIYISAVDKTALNRLITESQDAHNAAVEGSKAGQYPEGSKAKLQAEINSAKAAADNEAATDYEVAKAISKLSTALQTFIDSVIALTPDDLNGDGKISIGDLAIMARYYGKTSDDPNWQQYKAADLNGDGKIDIVDLAILARKILES